MRRARSPGVSDHLPSVAHAARIAAMADIATTIQTTPEGPTFALRHDVYRPGEAQELIADVVSLANATTPGKRYIVFGVEAVPGGAERRVAGIASCAQPADVAAPRARVHRARDPDRVPHRDTRRAPGRRADRPALSPGALHAQAGARRPRARRFLHTPRSRPRSPRARGSRAALRTPLRPGARASPACGWDSTANEPHGGAAAAPPGRRRAALSCAHLEAARADRGTRLRRRARRERATPASSAWCTCASSAPTYRTRAGHAPELERELAGDQASYREQDRHARYERDAARVNLTVVERERGAARRCGPRRALSRQRGLRGAVGRGARPRPGHVEGKRESAAVSIARTLGTHRYRARACACLRRAAARRPHLAPARIRSLPVRYELRAANLPVAAAGQAALRSRIAARPARCRVRSLSLILRRAGSLRAAAARLHTLTQGNGHAPGRILVRWRWRPPCSPARRSRPSEPAPSTLRSFPMRSKSGVSPTARTPNVRSTARS